MNLSGSYSNVGDVTDATNLLGSLSHSLSTRLIPLGLGKVRFRCFYTPVGSLSQPLFVPLIPSGA